MLNYWWVTIPKRKLNAVPEILACCANLSLNQEWQGHLYTHLAFEEALEKSGLNRIGERRYKRGGGGRTNYAWLYSLGLVFTHTQTGQTKLTLAGEAIMNGEPPVHILREQILKYQFPSLFSLSENSSKSRVNSRFKIRPFRFLLKLFRENQLDFYLKQEEISKILIVEAENETQKCYNEVVNKILKFRTYGDSSLDKDFYVKYAPSSGKVNIDHPFSHLTDVANTILNWLDYGQFISRDGLEITLLPDKIDEVDKILSTNPSFIDRPEEPEYFQRKYGLDPKRQKDTRNISNSQTITGKIIDEQKIKQAYVTESFKSPITKISTSLIDKITEQTGIDSKFIEETLLRLYPKGSVGLFMTEYFEMAFKGRDEATEFERATVKLFNEVFGFDTQHIGPIGLTPDVLILSDKEGYQAIIDNKAYSKYTISNDHYNRMVHNYIGNLSNYSNSDAPLAFFSYIASGFGNNINYQIQNIANTTNVRGSAISVSNMIKLVETYDQSKHDHKTIRNIFSVNRQVLLSDI